MPKLMGRGPRKPDEEPARTARAETGGRKVDGRFLDQLTNGSEESVTPGEHSANRDEPKRTAGLDYSQVGEHIGTVLAAAREAAETMKAQAEKEVEQLRLDANQQARQLLHKAREQTERATVEAAAVRERAEEYAARAREAAEETAADAIARAERAAAAKDAEMMDRQALLEENVEATEARLAQLARGLRELAATLEDLAAQPGSPDESSSRNTTPAPLTRATATD